MRFCYPVRPWKRFYITEMGFLSNEYYQKFGRFHRGADINLLTGGDSDLGTPVQSMFPGEVVYASTPPNSNWGGLVLVRSEAWVRDLVAQTLGVDIDELEILYAHLIGLSVERGDKVNAGDHLGGIGKGGFAKFYAHLHLEARTTSFDAWRPQGSTDEDRAFTEANCIDPLRLLTELPLADFPTLIPGGLRELLSRHTEVVGTLEPSGRVGVNRIQDKLYIRSLSE